MNDQTPGPAPTKGPSRRKTPRAATTETAADQARELRERLLELETENEQLRSEAEALRQSDTWATLILDTVPEAMLVVDELGRVVSANAIAHQVFGYPAGTMAKLSVEALIPDRFRASHPGHRTRFMAMPKSCVMGQGRELQARRRDGSEFPAEVGLASMRLGERPFVVVSVVDISARKRTEEEQRIAAIAFESQSGMMVTDPHGVILRVNRAFVRMTGFSVEEAVGQTPSLLRSGRHSAAFYQEMWAALVAKGYWQGQIWNRRKSGKIYSEWLTITAVKSAEGKVTHYVSTFSDITQNSEAEAQIHRLAYYDALTQLPNRRLLQDRLSQALATTSRNGLYGAILFLDIDNFKTVNDTRGHDTGDQLLVEVTQRLRQTVREGDTVARLGGDEFVVLLEELGNNADEAAALAKQVGEKLGEAISLPCQINGTELHCTASIGIGLFCLHDTVEDLLKHADLAMYHAKTSGRNTLRFFDPAMQARLYERSALETELRKALKQRQLQLHYQPQVDTRGRVIGAEALLRWQHPLRGLVAPGDFIPLAEESGLILPIGHWVLETACAQLAKWAHSSHGRDLVLAVNVSARQFRQPDFVAQVTAVLETSGANPARLKLELTESLVLENVADTIAKMRQLKMLGISFSMDDFGTGYSSLSYLTRLPLDQLKIDRSFVHNLSDNFNDGIIVRTIITMGRSLALDVVAEGVETEGQREFLERHGCHCYQGYLYGKPLPIKQFEALLKGR
jgi:diguanylate cyclase (GGDEF)-like protein/PAS domain S-box-containing protein